ncbi:hypothetical protein PIB30_002116 [Stylosanthes scabra]|uniref:Uncharacterized protein n=1 Tax=Stylosanthes scabra TaxID=79078 RepID=A0ABU6R487_9FABA|nr:hypothetical protein [Stylosanthes scabra]
MPHKKKQLRFKIPWISSSPSSSKQKSKPERPPFRPPGIAPAHTPALPHSSPSPSSRPPHSPASSVIVDSPVSSPSRPSTPLTSHEEDSSGQRQTTHHSASKQEQDEKEIVLVMDHDDEPIKEESSIERKMMFATSSSSSGKDIKVVSSSSGNTTMNVSTTTISANEEEKQNPNVNNNQLQKGIKENISSFVQKLATVTPTQPPAMEVDDEHKSFSVVTLAGDNKGATMNVAEGSSKKDGSIRIHRAYKKKDQEEEEEESTDAGDDDVAGNKAYVNSNIQSVNNSVMVKGSVSERDPGVRIVLPYHDEQKKNTTPEAKAPPGGNGGVSYPRPVVRRRCLRGMFMEPSDSDPDNPDKPRRHGCKFRCGDNNIM